MPIATPDIPVLVSIDKKNLAGQFIRMVIRDLIQRLDRDGRIRLWVPCFL